jgi:hypothetical protein
MKHAEFQKVVATQSGGTYGTVVVGFKPSLANLTLATGDSTSTPPEGKGDYILMGATEIESTAGSFDKFALPRFLSVADGKTYSFGIGFDSIGDDKIGNTFTLDVATRVKANGKKIAVGTYISHAPTVWEVEESVPVTSKKL